MKKTNLNSVISDILKTKGMSTQTKQLFDDIPELLESGED